VLGLIHDVGKITLFSELCKQFKLNNEDVDPSYQAFVPSLKKYSAALSYWIAKDWNMPDEIVGALGEQLKLKEGLEISSYGHILYQANLAAEVYAAIYPLNPNKAKKVIAELDLPENLFETFERVVCEL
jgi:HD-like signal output (HDOD) protein